MELATWNVNSVRARLPAIAEWLNTCAPDVLCLQETKVEDAQFPHNFFEERGYTHRAIYGQKSYNGVAILSKHPLENIQHGLVDETLNAQARLIAATVQGVRVYNGYIPNGEAVGAEKFAYKQAWLAALARTLREREKPENALILCGDINIAPEARDVWDAEKAKGDVLFTAQEHAWLADVLAFGLTDTLRLKTPEAGLFSWWDYRDFSRKRGFRIDHIFCTKALTARVENVNIHAHIRWAHEKPSDHVPVVITLTA
jgi:exodeoxyribonuclease-3